MKKWTAMLLVSLLLLGALTGCGSKEAASPLDSMALTDIIDGIYEKKDPGIPVATLAVDLSDANALQTYTGLTSADKISEAAVSEAAIGSQAYSLVLVRLKDQKDGNAVTEEMKAGINPAKWICVAADDLRVAADGNVALLIMVSSELRDAVTSEEIVAAFREVSGGSLDVEG